MQMLGAVAWCRGLLRIGEEQVRGSYAEGSEQEWEQKEMIDGQEEGITREGREGHSINFGFYSEEGFCTEVPCSDSSLVGSVAISMNTKERSW